MQTPPKKQIGIGAIPALFEKGTLPLYTETLIGTHQEPINLLILANRQCLIDSLAKAQWRQADTLSFHSLKQAARAAIFNQGYDTAPMTPSFYDARPHDLGFEKQTEKQTIRARHHARFWETRFTTASGTLFVGTVSLDTGIKWSITHTIAPDIDTERQLLASDLQSKGLLTHKEDLSLVPPTLEKNFTGDAFFTDGKAVFLILKSCTP
jgi:undecaprenyl-diphosphatase